MHPIIIQIFMSFWNCIRSKNTRYSKIISPFKVSDATVSDNNFNRGCFLKEMIKNRLFAVLFQHYGRYL